MINKGVVEPTVTMATSGVMNHSGEGSDEGGPTISHSKRAIENRKLRKIRTLAWMLMLKFKSRNAINRVQVESMKT
eukprot:2274847-Pyramimonas_sp.AAC.1